MRRPWWQLAALSFPPTGAVVQGTLQAAQVQPPLADGRGDLPHDLPQTELTRQHRDKIVFQAELEHNALPEQEVDREPTPWYRHWKSRHCEKQKHRDAKSNYYMYCHTASEVYYSPSLKFGYVKTPKSASTAFRKLFLEGFADTEVGLYDEMDLPEDAVMFTFVRNPLRQKLAAIAEIDALYANRMYKDQASTMNTTFQWVDRSVDNGRARLRAFLDDVNRRRFGDPTPEHWSPAHVRTQTAVAVCARRKLNFIGHLEQLDVDWQAVQALARIPSANRTRPISAEHANLVQEFPEYHAAEHVELHDYEKRAMCGLFASDFVCLGYEIPQVCRDLPEFN